MLTFAAKQNIAEILCVASTKRVCGYLFLETPYKCVIKSWAGHIQRDLGSGIRSNKIQFAIRPLD